jgi:hypothetical protein
VRGPADFDAAFVTATEARVDALYIVSSRLTLQNLGRRPALPLARPLARRHILFSASWMGITISTETNLLGYCRQKAKGLA